MVTALQIAGLSVTAVLIAKLLRRYAEEQAMLLTLLVIRYLGRKKTA